MLRYMNEIIMQTTQMLPSWAYQLQTVPYRAELMRYYIFMLSIVFWFL